MWKRFIDDMLLLWHHGLEFLHMFIHHLNTIHPTIEFTSEISSHQIPFVDMIIYIKEGKLNTRQFPEATDRHMYLNYNSEHLPSLKKLVYYLQFLRLKRILS